MTAMDVENSARGMAQYLRETLTHFVLDHDDEIQKSQLTKMGLQVLVTKTAMEGYEGQKWLAQEVLVFAQS